MLRHFITTINYRKLIEMQSSEPNYLNYVSKESKYNKKVSNDKPKVKKLFNRNI